jgi:hypothetical protein
VPGMVAKVRARLACRQVSTTSADAALSARIDVTAESANPHRRCSWGNGTQELSISEGRNTKPLIWLKKRLNKQSDAQSCFEVGGKFGLIFVNISELDDVDLPTLASEMERDPSDDSPSPSSVPAVLATVFRRDIWQRRDTPGTRPHRLSESVAC